MLNKWLPSIVIIIIMLFFSNASYATQNFCIFNRYSDATDYKFKINWQTLKLDGLSDKNSTEYVFTVIATQAVGTPAIWPQRLYKQFRYGDPVDNVIFTVGDVSTYPLKFDIARFPQEIWDAFETRCAPYGGGSPCRLRPAEISRIDIVTPVGEGFGSSIKRSDLDDDGSEFLCPE